MRPIGFGRGASLRQQLQRLSNGGQGQTQVPRRLDHADPPQHVAPITPLVGRGPHARDQPVLFIEAQCRRRDAAALRHLADAQFVRHHGIVAWHAGRQTLIESSAHADASYGACSRACRSAVDHHFSRLAMRSKLRAAASAAMGWPSAKAFQALLNAYRNAVRRAVGLTGKDGSMIRARKMNLASGQDIPCFALTGPLAGSDAGAMPDTGIICRGQWQGEEVVGGSRHRHPWLPVGRSDRLFHPSWL